MWLNHNLVVVATRNAGKVKEFASWFEAMNIEVKSLLDYEDLPEVIEDGDTFQDNAFKKAKTIGDYLNIPVIADDSGLSVDILDGEPGVFSARYAGEPSNDARNNQKLLQELGRRYEQKGQKPEEVDDKLLLSSAKFICALVLYDPKTSQTVETEGECPGYIISAPQGENGFGYDPLFYLHEKKCTMAELSKEEKNKISHRGHALEKLFEKLNKVL